MASAYPRQIVLSSLLIILLTFSINKTHSSVEETSDAPEFFYIKQNPNVDKANKSDNLTDISDKKIFFEVRGKNIYDGLRIKITENYSQSNSLCEEVTYKYNITKVSSTDLKWAKYVLEVPKSAQTIVYLCLPHNTKEHSGLIKPNLLGSELSTWYHQGPDIKLNLSDNTTLSENPPKPPPQIVPEHISSVVRRQENGNKAEPALPIRISAIRIEATYKDPDFDEDGIPVVLADNEHIIRLFGEGFTDTMFVAFTTIAGNYSDTCYLPKTEPFPMEKGSIHKGVSARVKVSIPPIPANAKSFYICVKESGSFVHQGTLIWTQIKTYTKPIPVWAAIIIIIVCLSFSALFSGLNLGLMSLDKTELKILCNTGSSRERKYARAIQPVRDHGNYLLCSILLANVFVNSIFTILLDDLTSGLIAVIFSTVAIVLFGEISPQAVCSRHGLFIGAKTIWITKFVMMITFPMSYPVAKLLDWMLGEEIGNVYTRERLKELVMVTTGENDLDKDEVNIISGALELRKKTVSDVMTKIEDVFMLDYESVLDFETVSEIMKSGYSRVPVYEGNRQNIVTMLYIKDLAFVDPDDNTPLKTLCQFYQNPCNFVFEDTTLDVMFRIFKEGNKGHMAFVHRVNNEGEGDPFYETVGLITLEDVIEELIQAEIMDETDVFTDNRSKRRRNAERKDFTAFAEKRGEPSRVRISPQLALAAFQYLSTTVEPFHPNVISPTILTRLLKQDIIHHIRKNKEWRTDPINVIYSQGKAVDYFVIILEGRVDVTVGKENLLFEGGPFTYFGTQALVQTVGIDSVTESPVAPAGMGSLESLNIDSMLRHTFIPDYTVRANSEVLYLKIKRSLYLAAKRATLMEKSKVDSPQTHEQFEEEVDKLLHSLDEDDSVSQGRLTPRRKSSRNLQKSQPDLELNQLSPKTPSHYSNASPPHRLNIRGDINGSIKNSPVDDIHPVTQDEEVSLLPKKS